jgi:nucleoside-diphosphate-sugar epimerase
MNKDAKIYIAGHRGLVGSAIVRELKKQSLQVTSSPIFQKYFLI